MLTQRKILLIFVVYWGICQAQASSTILEPLTVAKATFAGGCFWCMEKPFDELSGVLQTISGYTGGKTIHPTYEQVSSGVTGHLEAIQITYDPTKVTYEKLLDVFWHNVDPTDATGQFCDKGDQYRSVIFFADDQQKRLAEHSKAMLEKDKPFREPIATLLLPAAAFFPAEDYHQDYYQKNPVRYHYYRHGCGRDSRLEAVWGKH